MKKTICTVLAMLFMVSGCSYVSWLNPWSEDEKPTEELVPQFEPNKFMWQASLDKLAFMKIEKEDKDEGTIITGWYQPGTAKKERLQIKVRVLSSALRADCLKATVYRQILINGKWVDEEADVKLANITERAILDQARVLYKKSLEINEN